MTAGSTAKCQENKGFRGGSPAGVGAVRKHLQNDELVDYAFTAATCSIRLALSE
jgi:hypothetical protein